MSEGQPATERHRHTDDLPDDELVRMVVDGDEAAMSTLYRRYVGPIYRFVLAQVRVEADAEDLTADTFASMLRALHEFRGDASFKNWLYQIARNAVRNHRRSARYRLTGPLLPTIEAPPPKLDGAVDRAADREEVLRLLKPLPPRYRRVLELRFLRGMTIADSARRMDITVSNCKVLQHRALKKAAAMHAERQESQHAAH